MGLLRNASGTLIVLPLAYIIATSTGLEEQALIALGINWFVALVQAIPRQDEMYFDLMGSVTNGLVALAAFLHSDDKTWRKAMLTAMVVVWCTRLGTFCFRRICKIGEDCRFLEIRTNPVRFFGVWTIQGLWVLLTQIAVLLHFRHAVVNTYIEIVDIVGAAVWFFGFVIEVVADQQKTAFRTDARNKHKFIQNGLWYYSRHPNYCGEIMMWIGIFAISVHCLPTTFYQAMGAISPVFVMFLLMFVSGVPMLEKKADAKWGKLESYQKYKKTTSVLLLLPKF